jgi:hypothetical protein
MRFISFLNEMLKHIVDQLLPSRVTAGRLWHKQTLALADWLWQTGFWQIGFGRLALVDWLWQTGSGRLALADWLWQTGFGRLVLADWLWQTGFGRLALADWLW